MKEIKVYLDKNKKDEFNHVRANKEARQQTNKIKNYSRQQETQGYIRCNMMFNPSGFLKVDL